jgi:hypothetical protein
MKQFVDRYNNPNKIRTNYIVISNGRSYQSIIKELMLLKNDLPLVNGKKIKTDGIIIGSTRTKFHYKWKPPHKLTIDFYLIFKENIMHMYVGERRYNAKRSVQTKSYKNLVKSRKSPTIIGSGQYVHLLFRVQKMDDKGTYMEWKDKYDRKIVECMRSKDDLWKPINLRQDKKVPNNIRTAKNNLYILNNPIKFTDLIT